MRYTVCPTELVFVSENESMFSRLTQHNNTNLFRCFLLPVFGHPTSQDDRSRYGAIILFSADFFGLLECVRDCTSSQVLEASQNQFSHFVKLVEITNR